jgi:hypothetical protein
MTLFEGYMSKTRGGSASFIAKQRSERDDRFTTPQPGHAYSQAYEASPASGYGVGGYMPYTNRPRTPQYSGMPQLYPVAQQYPQHLTPSGPAHGHPGIPAPFMNPDSSGHIPTQAEPYRPATHQQIPGGVSPSHPAFGHVDQTGSHNAARPPPSGMPFPPRDQYGGSSTGRQGYEATQ